MKTIQNFSSPWTEWVFEKRNRSYGAYQMRLLEHHNQMKAVFFTAVFITLILGFSKLYFSQEKIEMTELYHSTTPIILTENPIYKPIPKIKMSQTPKEGTIQNSNQTPKIVANTSAPSSESPVYSTTIVQNDEIPLESSNYEGTADILGNSTSESPGAEGFTTSNTSGSNATTELVLVPDEMPQFPGGLAALIRFLTTNIKYPQIAKENGIEGTVLLSFIIDRTGRIKDGKIERWLGASCDEEALRVLQLMPSWIPGKMNGKPVAVKYYLPMKFVLK